MSVSHLKSPISHNSSPAKARCIPTQAFCSCCRLSLVSQKFYRDNVLVQTIVWYKNHGFLAILYPCSPKYTHILNSSSPLTKKVNFLSSTPYSETFDFVQKKRKRRGQGDWNLHIKYESVITTDKNEC